MQAIYHRIKTGKHKTAYESIHVYFSQFFNHLIHIVRRKKILAVEFCDTPLLFADMLLLLDVRLELSVVAGVEVPVLFSFLPVVLSDAIPVADVWGPL